MRAILNYAYVPPAGVMALVEIAEPPMPGDSEVLVGMDFSHICHDDLLFLSGQRPYLPALPCVPGCCGLGTVQFVGCAVTHLKIGDRVLLPRNRLTWAERLVVSTNEVVALSSEDNLVDMLRNLKGSSLSSGGQGEGAGRIEPCEELVKYLSALMTDARTKTEFATVFPLWQINEAIQSALAGYYVLLRISRSLPTSI